MPAIISLIPDVIQGRRDGNSVEWPANMRSIAVTGLLSDQDLGDETKTLTIGLDVSYDGGANWQSAIQPSAWTGATLPKNATAGPPWLVPEMESSYSQSQVIPTHARPHVDCPLAISVGLSVLFSA